VVDDTRPDLGNDPVHAGGIPQVNLVDAQAGQPRQALPVGAATQEQMHLASLLHKPPGESTAHKPGCAADQNTHRVQNSLMLLII